jgi:hypothetical protein
VSRITKIKIHGTMLKPVADVKHGPSKKDEVMLNTWERKVLSNVCGPVTK